MKDNIKRRVVCFISKHGGSISAEDLLVKFRRAVMPDGRIDRSAYDDFIAVVQSVAIKHESEFFGPSWILKKPPRRF